MDARLLSREMVEIFRESYHDFDTPEGADVRRLLAHISAQDETIQRLREALRPFATQPPHDEYEDDDDAHVLVGHLRNAERVYEETQG